MCRGVGIDVALGQKLKCPFPYQGPQCPEVLLERLQEAQAVALGVDIETRPRITREVESTRASAFRSPRKT